MKQHTHPGSCEVRKRPTTLGARLIWLGCKPYSGRTRNPKLESREFFGRNRNHQKPVRSGCNHQRIGTPRVSDYAKDFVVLHDEETLAEQTHPNYGNFGKIRCGRDPICYSVSRCTERQCPGSVTSGANLRSIHGCLQRRIAKILPHNSCLLSSMVAWDFAWIEPAPHTQQPLPLRAIPQLSCFGQGGEELACCGT